MATYKINYTSTGVGPDSIEAETVEHTDKAGGWLLFLGYGQQPVLALRMNDVKSYQIRA